jgi:hypothetical protein
MLTLIVNDQLLIETYERIFVYFKRLWGQARHDNWNIKLPSHHKRSSGIEFSIRYKPGLI